jgi:hypothetical protein
LGALLGFLTIGAGGATATAAGYLTAAGPPGTGATAAGCFTAGAGGATAAAGPAWSWKLEFPLWLLISKLRS